jgi:hypothetical protein
VSCWRQLGGTVAAIFVVAVFANYLWELAQAPLYVSLESFRTVAWHCFVASLGDGLLVLAIFATGWVVLRRHTWFVHPGVTGYGVMVATGLVMGMTVEWVAVHILVRWMYTAWMPRVPGLAVGLVLVLQMPANARAPATHFSPCGAVAWPCGPAPITPGWSSWASRWERPGGSEDRRAAPA